MELFDRYIRMLQVFLPRAQRDDIARELSEEIHAEAVDRQAAIGRPLTGDEQAAILFRYGHPMLTATRYRPQQHLVGPVIFPYYWLALKVVLGLVLAGHAIAGIVLLASGASGAEFGQALEDTVENLFAVIG